MDDITKLANKAEAGGSLRGQSGPDQPSEGLCLSCPCLQKEEKEKRGDEIGRSGI